MGRKLRRNVGLVTLFLGLLLVTVAGYELLRDDPKSSPAQTAGLPDPDDDLERQINPVDPGGSKVGKVRRGDGDTTPDPFAHEYGDRGRHKVTLTVRGTGYNAVWRDGHKESGAGGMSRTRTVTGGFPIVIAFIVGQGSRASCVVTVDGIQKESKSAARVPGAVICQA